MDGVTQIALPASLLTALMLVFQYGKMLLANVPGFRQSDADHAQHFQIVFFVLCLLSLGGYLFATAAHPVDANGWLAWAWSVVQSAIGMAFGGSFVYSKMSNGASGASSSDGAGDPTETQNGLPLTIGQ